MPTITLHSIGGVVGFGTGSVVGSAPQWGDGSDATYATSSDGTRFYSQLETLVLPAGATVTAIRGEVRASAASGTTLQTNLASSTTAGSGFVTYFTSDSDPTVFTTTVPTTATTVPLIQSTHEVDQDPVAVLEAGGWVEATRFGTGTSFTVYEFTVFVDYDAAEPTFSVVPPLRQHPRSDGLGSSSAVRKYPPFPSIQASNRRGPSAIL